MQLEADEEDDMSVIERSGFYQTDNGESFLLTQGLVGYTLIAGKQCLFRLFLDPNAIAQSDYLVVTIGRQSSQTKFSIIAPKANLIFEAESPNGPSIGIIIRGFAFPQADTYTVTLSVRSAQGAVLAQPNIDALSFHPTK